MLTWLEFSFVLVLPGWHDSKRLTGVLLVRTRDIVAPVLTVIARDDDRDFRSVGLSIAPRVEFDTYPVRLRLVEGTFHRMTDLRAVAPSIATAQQGTSRIAHDPHRQRRGSPSCTSSAPSRATSIAPPAPSAAWSSPRCAGW